MVVQAAVGNIVVASVGKSHLYDPSVMWVSFFVLLLLSIAVLPLVAEHWWESNKNKAIVAGVLSLPVLIFYAFKSPVEIQHSLLEYISFIVLLWALYTISGGIVLRGSLKSTPLVNTAFLAIGGVIANLFGTTGAAMLLIRPLLRTNEKRKIKKHIVIFFIFVVANVGGCLTPLGDPPLFLGYLRGVPFTWTLKLAPIWAPTVITILAIFFIWDTIAYRKESKHDIALSGPHEKIQIVGLINFIFILGVLCATLFSNQLMHITEASGFGWGEGSPWREIIMITMGLLSMKFTPKKLRQENRFNFDAIIEVAVLFAGIFITMIPALALLQLHGDQLGVTEPWQYMWATGLLSSFLDNAPTYLVFASMAQGTFHLSSLPEVIAHTEGVVLLKAISIGAVFMGANTYIGNAPNFMVKVIAETAKERRVRMPSFFGYMAYSGGILLPLYAIVSLVAFVLLRGYL